MGGTKAVMYQSAAEIPPRGCFDPHLGSALAERLKNSRRAAAAACWFFALVLVLCLLCGSLQENDQGSNGGAHVCGSDLGSRNIEWTERAQ